MVKVQLYPGRCDSNKPACTVGAEKTDSNNKLYLCSELFPQTKPRLLYLAIYV